MDACNDMEPLLEKTVLAYRGGEQVTLGVGERDGHVVIGLTIVGGSGDARACLLDPSDAGDVVQALQEAIARAKVRRES